MLSGSSVRRLYIGGSKICSCSEPFHLSLDAGIIRLIELSIIWWARVYSITRVVSLISHESEHDRLGVDADSMVQPLQCAAHGSIGNLS